MFCILETELAIGVKLGANTISSLRYLDVCENSDMLVLPKQVRLCAQFMSYTMCKVQVCMP